jgi:hypothetical protein
MYKFSKRSIDNMLYIHEDLKLILEEAIKEIDFTVLCGHRTTLEQYKLYGDTGLGLMDNLVTLNRGILKLEKEFEGREQELVMNKDYLNAIEARRKAYVDLKKLDLDTVKTHMEIKKLETEEDKAIDIDFEQLDN